MRRRSVTACFIIAVFAGVTRADFVLWDDEYLKVTTLHTKGFLYNSSVADVQSDMVYDAYINDDARLNVIGGHVARSYAYNNGQIGVSSGSAGEVDAHDHSQVAMDGGIIYNLRCHDNSQATVSAGSITTSLNTYDNSELAILDAFVKKVSVYHSSRVKISDRSVIDSISVHDSSEVTLSGCRIDGGLSAGGNSTIVIHGDNFRTSEGANLIDNELIGTGLLIGRWLDGTSFILSIHQNEHTATILAVTGPFTEPTCTEPIVGDLNNDCKVNFVDLAVMAASWMTCNLQPQTACWE